MKYISILGSTGSIGTQALQVIQANPDLRAIVLTGNNNIDLLTEQTAQFHPEAVCVYNEEKADEFRKRLSSEYPEIYSQVSVYTGMEGLIKAASYEKADIVLTAIVGMAGIRPTMAAINAGKDIALANKETLVCAGSVIMEAARNANVKIYPVDSEHSAIFQCLNSAKRSQASKILLTASGGPFRGRTFEELSDVTVAQALNHPNWKMGKKVTIDSATLANKGLEVIEARWLFDMSPERIEVLVHPQSVVHSAVEFADGAVIAQLGVPDMKLPIQYAFTYPDRRNIEGKRLDLFEIHDLTFERPDTRTFRALDLAFRALDEGGTMPCVFNAANEAAVRKFLDGEMKFTQIAEYIEYEMDRHTVISEPTLEQIIEVGEDIISK